MTSLFDLAQIILIDLSMAGDNALVVGAAAASLPVPQRKQAMTAGIAAATIARIVMALFATQLLHVTGLLVAGGFLLLWVGWKMLREMRGMQAEKDSTTTPAKKLSAAIAQIIIADLSMSLDNVLGVAGVARDHRWELVAGLGLSVMLMGLASAQIARLTARYPKLVYIGVAVIFFTAVRMIYDGV